MFNNAKPYEGYTKVMGKSLGCYSQDILVKSSNLTSRLNWTNATVKRCWTHCAKQRFAFDGYAALQNRLHTEQFITISFSLSLFIQTLILSRSNCLCSLDINNKTSYKRNDCNKTCAANKKETCGGNSSVSLYEIKTILIG